MPARRPSNQRQPLPAIRTVSSSIVLNCSSPNCAIPTSPASGFEACGSRARGSAAFGHRLRHPRRRFMLTASVIDPGLSNSRRPSLEDKRSTNRRSQTQQIQRRDEQPLRSVWPGTQSAAADVPVARLSAVARDQSPAKNTATVREKGHPTRSKRDWSVGAAAMKVPRPMGRGIVVIKPGVSARARLPNETDGPGRNRSGLSSIPCRRRSRTRSQASPRRHPQPRHPAQERPATRTSGHRYG